MKTILKLNLELQLPSDDGRWKKCFLHGRWKKHKKTIKNNPDYEKNARPRLARAVQLENYGELSRCRSRPQDHTPRKRRRRRRGDPLMKFSAPQKNESQNCVKLTRPEDWTRRHRFANEDPFLKSRRQKSMWPHGFPEGKWLLSSADLYAKLHSSVSCGSGLWTYLWTWSYTNTKKTDSSTTDACFRPA